MHLRLIAVGDRQPSWVDAAVTDYARRLPRQWQFRVEAIASAKRAGSAARAMADEAGRLLGKLQKNERLVLLDERGRAFSSRAIADRLGSWQADGRDVAFVIGGADGVDRSVAERADESWSLSSLTLPHGIARILVVEQLYRAWSLSTGHPYHRD